MSWSRIAGTAAIVVLLVLAAGLGPAQAGKPSKPPPPPPPPSVDGGTIYLNIFGSGPSTINPDGTGAQALPSGVWGEPSRGTYAYGTEAPQRWFLQRLAYVDPDHPNETYPNEYPRVEVYAVRGDGKATIRITNGRIEDDGKLVGWIELNSTLTNGIREYPGAPPVWAGRLEGTSVVEDGRIAFLGKTWALDGNGAWYVAKWGIYEVDFDPSSLTESKPTDPDALPVWIDVEVPLLISVNKPDGKLYVEFDYAPDGEALALSAYDRVLGVPDSGEYSFSRWDRDTQAQTLLFHDAYRPQWSPTGDRVAFLTMSITSTSGGAFVHGDIATVDPYDPSDVQIVVPKPKDTRRKNHQLSAHYWSPHGTHLTYQMMTYAADPPALYETYRVAADGTGITMIRTDSTPFGWR